VHGRSLVGGMFTPMHFSAICWQARQTQTGSPNTSCHYAAVGIVPARDAHTSATKPALQVWTLAPWRKSVPGHDSFDTVHASRQVCA